MQAFLDAIQAGASGQEIGAIPLPEAYRAAVVRKDEQEMFAGIPSDEKDPRKSLHLEEVAVPELAPDEVYVAVMASAINFNTVWTSIFEPLPTFGFLQAAGQGERLGQAPRPALPRGRLRRRRASSSGSARRCATGSRATGSSSTATTSTTRTRRAHDDSMLAANQRIWGFESNFGGLADLALVKANQLMPKPAHLSWEEAAVQRPVQLHLLPHARVSRNGAGMKQGDVVLIWGATGGLGGYAVQYVLNGGGIPVGVVSSPDKAEHPQRPRLRGGHRPQGRPATGSGPTSTPRTSRSGAASARTSGPWSARTPTSCSSIPGRQTMGASVFVCARGGTIVTCAATSGYMIEYDNRHLWMKLKTIKSSHFANYQEAWDANRLIAKGMIQPILSVTYPLEQTGEAAYQVHRNLHEGKIGGALPGARRRARHRRPRVPGQGRRGQDHPVQEGGRMSDAVLTEIDHVAIAVRDLDAAIAWYAENVRGDRRPPRDRIEQRRRRGGPAQGGRLLHPAADADLGHLAGGQVPRAQRRGHPPRRLPGRRLRRGARDQ